jgi:hypothetical protein
MNESELLSLFGYYMGIIAFLFAFFTSKIDDWKQRVDQLVNEWEPGEQKTNAVFKARQKGQRKTLKGSKPHFALWAPIGIAALLLTLGCFALAKSAETVDKVHSLLLLVLPAVVLLVLHLAYGCHIIRRQNRSLEGLQ